jgi:hypothetical protein
MNKLDGNDDRTQFQRFVDGDGPPGKPTYVYVASSWTNPFQPIVVTVLRRFGMEVYDFRHPEPNNDGFQWSAVDLGWETWSPRQWRDGLSHPVAEAGFILDKKALDRADCGVLVLPCGRSAHLEAGYLAGRGQPVFTLALDDPAADKRPVADLMTLLLGPAKRVCCSFDELFDRLGCETHSCPQ